MKAYQLQPGDGIAGLRRIGIHTPTPLPHQVLVRTRAAALNYRDLMFARGNYGGHGAAALVPLGDGAGDVVAVGAHVTRFKPGDRVIHAYFPGWADGAPTPAKTAASFGTHIDGTLAEAFVADEAALAHMPAHMDYVQAATLSCAGTTAWNALFVAGRLKPGASVLLLGTGGVSVIALQLARAAGLAAIVTSSSDEKLERARELGAAGTINYRATPEWQEEVLRLTGGRGVDLTVETGGEGTLARSIAATAMGGTVAVIGITSGLGGAQIDPISLIAGAKRLSGIFVGSRVMLEDLVRFTEAARIKPVVDRVFTFDQAAEAYTYVDQGRHFGKVVVTV
ncbi:NADPH:quinone reductase-like Zn-dependent oxidoreductase [Pseudoduganella flava]|uniref:NADPH:quinone reductase-like Zn-dependent oxidoreductase n=1 Tax=Pseudoduganella flava TaxID=871742 RepID=A0A562PIU0_9BURK|nr:NAD(P)-dependent alcohol dehydrogenase [Pseudoduganella flava]QGZ41919.1 zinc-binding dehydrogenase [Pseudoduganella flava]TWI44327.1 NADPH:quinone reductase-like Zn-dependent oxidoreductase [Pseudoduganella flava]